MSDVNMALPEAGGTPPTVQDGQGLPYKAPSRGGLPLKVVAAIQMVYKREAQKQEKLQATNQNLALQPGWGGQGR